MAHTGIAVGAAYLIEQAISIINRALPGETAYCLKPLREYPATHNCDVKTTTAAQVVNTQTSKRRVFHIDVQVYIIGFNLTGSY